MPKHVRVAFVGAGARTVRELLDLVRLDGVQIAGLCDVEPDRARQSVERVNARRAEGSAHIAPRIVPSVRALLDEVDCDAVYVSLPPFAHGEVEHALIDAGKALLVEKPLAVERSVAREIAAHLRERDALCLVGYQWRYGETVERARRMLEGVPIGLVLCIRWSGLPGTPWWRVQRLSGGMLVEQHTHSVDVMRLCCGEVEEVYAAAATALLRDVPDLTIFDVNAVTLRFASGAVGTIQNTCAAPQGGLPYFHSTTHVVAAGMTLAIGLGKLVVLRADGRQEEYVDAADANLAMNRAFVEAVATGDRSLLRSPYDDALKTFELTLAAQRSAELRRPLAPGVDWT